MKEILINLITLKLETTKDNTKKGKWMSYRCLGSVASQIVMALTGSTEREIANL
jgi:hypothetical protein